MTTRLSRVILWVGRFSFSPCIQRVSAVFTSTPDLSSRPISIIFQPFILCSTLGSLFSQDEVWSSSGWSIPVISRS